MSNPATIIMIEDDGHARLIERNIRRPASNDRALQQWHRRGELPSRLQRPDHKGKALRILLDLNLPDMTDRILQRVKERRSQMRPGGGTHHHR